MNKNILHITDLHLDDPASTNEKLRTGFYKDFILSLADKIKGEVKKIDLILCTGDIINKGNTANFEHARHIFDYLLEQLDLKPDKIFFCIGNHDITVNNGIADNLAFNAFTSRYGQANILAVNNYFTLYHCNVPDLNILTFNSVTNSDCSINKISPQSNNAAPNSLEDSHIDEVMTQLHDITSASTDLIVMSHFPPMISPRYGVILEENGWIEKHLWKSGQILSDRILTRRKKSRTIWLSGDSHMPDFFSLSEFSHFSMTGMIGGDFINIKDPAGKPYNKTNEVKVITFEDKNPAPNYYTFIYKAHGFYNSPQTGEWTVNSSQARIPKAEPDTDLPKLSGQAALAKPSADLKTQVISSSVEPDILSTIIENRLYEFDRFATSPKESALGWIKIFELFQKTELLARCIDKSVEWILSLALNKGHLSDTILIGIDYWGSIFASQVSIRMGYMNYCISARENGKQIHLHESCDYLCRKLESNKHVKNIILFTDVISTGSTVVNIKTKVTRSLKNNNTCFYVISIISDKLHSKIESFNSFITAGTFCSELPIPIISNDLLPAESILPPRYDIR